MRTVECNKNCCKMRIFASQIKLDDSTFRCFNDYCKREKKPIWLEVFSGLRESEKSPFPCHQSSWICLHIFDEYQELHQERTKELKKLSHKLSLFPSARFLYLGKYLKFKFGARAFPILASVRMRRELFVLRASIPKVSFVNRKSRRGENEDAQKRKKNMWAPRMRKWEREQHRL